MPAPDLGFGSEGEPIRPRPAAQVAPRPLAFPSLPGAAMTVAGSLLVLVGALMLTVPERALTVFGFGGGRVLPVVVGGVLVLVALGGRFSPSRVVRAVLVAGAAVAATLALIDTHRLGGAPRSAGMGVMLAGALVVIGGTFLRDRR